MPPRPAEAEPRSPDDFAHVLATQEPLLVVGGQAINLWALHYHERTAALALFVSRDVDVLGTRETLGELAKLAGTKAQFFPTRPPTNEVGVVIAHDHRGQPMLVEVLHRIHGVANADLLDPAYTFSIGHPPVSVKAPGPITLLRAKLANVADLPPAGRQDTRHVVILMRLLPAYLKDLQNSVLRQSMTERKLLDFLDKLLAAVTTMKARKVLKQLNLDPPSLFTEMSSAKLPKLRAFLAQRLPRTLSH